MNTIRNVIAFFGHQQEKSFAWQDLVSNKNFIDWFRWIRMLAIVSLSGNSLVIFCYISSVFSWVFQF